MVILNRYTVPPELYDFGVRGNGKTSVGGKFLPVFCLYKNYFVEVLFVSHARQNIRLKDFVDKKEDVFIET